MTVVTIPLQASPTWSPAFAGLRIGETQERGRVCGPDGLDQVFVYPFHVDITRRYFAEHGITGPHAFTQR